MNTVTSYLLAISTVVLGAYPFAHHLRTDPVRSGDSFGLESIHALPSDHPYRQNFDEFASDTIPDDSLVYRVQIITSLYENSFPTVFIEGEMYDTYEYFYLGSYRITVGKFDTYEEAREFRLKCLNSGFKQAFVAAFRGDTRVTDPSVFKE